MYTRINVKCPLFLWDFVFSWLIFEKLKYQVQSKFVLWKPSSSMRKDGRTDKRKLVVALHNFSKAPENRLSNNTRGFVSYPRNFMFKHFCIRNTLWSTAGNGLMLQSVCFCCNLHVLTLNQPRFYVRPKIGHCHSRKDESAWISVGSSESSYKCAEKQSWRADKGQFCPLDVRIIILRSKILSCAKRLQISGNWRNSLQNKLLWSRNI